MTDASSMEREHTVRIGSGGRLVIPAQLRRRMGLRAGDPLILRLSEEGLILTTPERAIRTAQALVRAHVAKKRRLVDELIEERRREADEDGP